jgi:hypothetical protein
MSGIAKRMLEMFKSIKDAVQEFFPGLKNAGPEVKAELSRMGTQGAMELASALFNGHGFVPYGPGQYTPSAEHDQQHDQQHDHQQQEQEQQHDHQLEIER